jgi:hypothetical protein
VAPTGPATADALTVAHAGKECRIGNGGALTALTLR